MRRISSVLVLVVIIGLAGFGQGKIVIGHRGAAGYLPEHTLEGYAYAYALGADYIEPDLIITKDGQFICMHDIYLEPTTDVERLFPDRKRNDGHWYAADFSLNEIKTLSVHERCKSNGNPYFPDRFPVDASRFCVPTFAEMIELIQGLNNSTGCNVGIYPELKRPAWHSSEGLPMEEAILDLLDRYGYCDADAKVYIQSFEADSLKRLRFDLGTNLNLLQAISASFSYSHMWTKGGLDEIAGYANAIGPSKTIIESNPAYVEWAHTRGLLVHPYTFRKDDLPAKYDSLEAEIDQFFFAYGVDGLFTDFVDVALGTLRKD
jgi:glycerophosphoryl diester phosphodiesterase